MRDFWDGGSHLLFERQADAWQRVDFRRRRTGPPPSMGVFGVVLAIPFVFALGALWLWRWRQPRA